ncbi:MAG: acylphosphatase [Ignavibacteriales bacterium]|nr:acylphosphatase [Ignavibacteriales bacterium]
MNEHQVHMIVRGMVQGVGFRYFVYQRAIGLGLKGYVRNLSNGNVEIEVSGNRSLVEELIQMVKIGPRASKVTDVQIQIINSDLNHTSFEKK